MEEPKWIETKKEFEVLENGTEVLHRVTKEVEKVERKQRLARKDWIDYTFRLIALLAIGIPVWLFYQNQQNEIRKNEKNTKKELYENIIQAFRTYLNLSDTSKSDLIVLNQIRGEHLETILRIDKTPLAQTCYSITEMCRFYLYAKRMTAAADTLSNILIGLNTIERRTLADSTLKSIEIDSPFGIVISNFKEYIPLLPQAQDQNYYKHIVLSQPDEFQMDFSKILKYGLPLNKMISEIIANYRQFGPGFQIKDKNKEYNVSAVLEDIENTLSDFEPVALRFRFNFKNQLRLRINELDAKMTVQLY